MIWQRWLVGLTLLAGLLSLIVVLDYTGYPYPVWRLLVFEYLLREQDIAGSVFFIAIALAACLPRTRSRALDFVQALGRNPWAVAAVAFVALCAAMFAVALNHALAGDEHLTLFQSRAFAAGRLTGELPPDLVFRLIPAYYQWRWLIASETTGQVAIVYWPGFSLLLAPFSLVGVPWACNPLLAALSLVLMAKLATRLTGNDAAGGWAMLLALASPGFTAMALSYFSMTAHLFLNLLFAWLLVQGGFKRCIAAGIVGSLALVLSNPVPHILFALPWLVWIARWPHARRNLVALGAGYAPLCLVVGVGWWLFLRGLQGRTTAELFPSDDDPFHRLGNLLWYLHMEFRAVFMTPGGETIAHRIAEQARLWTWAVPGLPLLAIAGWWLQRRVAEVNLLALSLLITLFGYLFVLFDQGYGWGARYVHSAWGALPVLAAAAMVSLGDGESATRVRSYVVRLALLSLVFGTALRFFQIRLFMDDQLSIRPPFEKGVRQVVFIAPNSVYYTQDFLQNDPFLRDPVIFMASRGIPRDEELIKRRFPGARKTYDAPNGQVWRLE
jgi:hypothetical protein